MTIFVTADTHFNHVGVLAMCGRPFADVAEHNEFLVQAWNSVVGPRDEVWHLGDFALGGTPEELAALFRRLRGRKILCRGNHDKTKTTGLGWHAVYDLATPKLAGERWVFSHYPMRAWVGAFRGSRHCFGHTHGLLPDTARSCDVGVDRWGYRPASLEEIRERMAATPEEPEELRLGRAMEAEGGDD
ncbi:metallophosphoesterase [Methylobacterium aquaticum]|nr:metallophosphoesterase [Methylobacterium aquaticum]QRE78082.1 metallophosphoesterase [Methylobacterium aquaticum]